MPSTISIRMVFALCFAMMLVCFSTSISSADIVYGHTGDAERASDGSLAAQTATTLRAGRLTSGSAVNLRNGILVFDISGVTDAFATANLGLFYDSKTAGGSAPLYNVDLYGVGFGSSATIPAGASFSNTNTGSGSKIQDNFITPTTAANSMLFTDSGGDASLLAFLNTRPTGTGGNFVFFRANQDASAGGNNRFYSVRSADFSGTDSDPRLTFTTVPEPGSLMFVSGLVGLVVLRRKRSR